MKRYGNKDLGVQVILMMRIAKTSSKRSIIWFLTRFFWLRCMYNCIWKQYNMLKTSWKHLQKVLASWEFLISLETWLSLLLSNSCFYKHLEIRKKYTRVWLTGNECIFFCNTSIKLKKECIDVTRVQVTNSARAVKISLVLTFYDAFSCGPLTTFNMISHAISFE